MTLEEAIAHCEEKAKELRAEAEEVRDLGEHISNPKQPYNEPVVNCLECAKEHEQLAEWLKELQKLRKCRECPLVKEECKLCGFDYKEVKND